MAANTWRWQALGGSERYSDAFGSKNTRATRTELSCTLAYADQTLRQGSQDEGERQVGNRVRALYLGSSDDGWKYTGVVGWKRSAYSKPTPDLDRSK